MTIFAKIYLKSTVMACSFVSQTFAATALVEKYDAYRKEAYNGLAWNPAVPGYTIKLKNIFRNKPAKRQANLQEKETILKAVIATALIHDDNITLFDSADDDVPEFDSNDGSVRSHFQILWYAEHFARNSIRKMIAGDDHPLVQKYTDAKYDDLHQLHRLGGIRPGNFKQWVIDVYNEYSTGLYMEGSPWRTSTAYKKNPKEYEELADEHYRNSAVENDRKSTPAYTRPDLRSASAASATASESAYGHRVKGQPKVEVVGEFAQANKRLHASASASAATAVSESAPAKRIPLETLSGDSSGRLQESSVASAASARSSVEEAMQDSTVRAAGTAAPSAVEKVILHGKELDSAEIYRVYKRKRDAGEDMFKSMNAAVPYDNRFKDRFVNVPRPMPEGYGSLSHESESYNKERSMLRQKLEYDYLEKAGDQAYVGITTVNNRGVKTTKKHFIKYAYEIYKFERESDREDFTKDVPYVTLLRLLGVNTSELCEETHEQGEALRGKLRKRYVDSGDHNKYAVRYGPGGRF